MNPAALLLDLLTAYARPDNGSTYTPWERWHLDDNETTNTLSTEDRARLLEAALWLKRLSAILDAFEQQGRRVDFYRRHFTVWLDSVYNIGKDWYASYSSEQICPQASLDVLAGLAETINLVTINAGSDAHERLIKMTNEVEELIEIDDTLSENLRKHLRRILDRLQELIAHPEQYDINDVANTLDDLFVATDLASLKTESSKARERWEKIHSFYVAPTISSLIAGVATPPAIEVVSHIAKSITG